MNRPSLVPRPTLYKGILMRSRLEADYARHLDQCYEPWQYEPRCFADERGQYLPDFRIVPAKVSCYIEVKPVRLTVAQIGQVLDRMAIVWSSEPDATLKLVLWRYQADEGSLELVVYGRVDRTAWLTFLDEDLYPGWFWSKVKTTVRWPE